MSNPYADDVNSYSGDDAKSDTGVSDLTDEYLPAYSSTSGKLVDTSAKYDSESDLIEITNLNTSGQFEMDGTFKWGASATVYSVPYLGSDAMLSMGSNLRISPTLQAFYPSSSGGMSIGRSGSIFQYGWFDTLQAETAVYTDMLISTLNDDLVINGNSANILFKYDGTTKLIFNETSIYPETTNSFSLGSSTQFYSVTYTNKITPASTLAIDSSILVNSGSNYQVKVGDTSNDIIAIGLSGRTAAGQPTINFNSSTYGNGYDSAIIASEGADGENGGGNITIDSAIFRVLGDQLAESARGNKGAGYVGGYTQYQGVISNQALTALTWASVFNFSLPTTGNVIIFGNIQISSLTTGGVQSAGISTSTGEIAGYNKGTAYGTTTCPACIVFPPTFDYTGAANTYYLNVMSSSDQTACYITYNFTILNIN